MRAMKLIGSVLVPVMLLGACASEPLGPTVAVMPAPGKPFDAFQGDQALCKQFASGEVQGGSQQANNRQVGTAIVGTLLGAGVGCGTWRWPRRGDRGGGGGAGRYRRWRRPVPTRAVQPAAALRPCVLPVHVFPRQSGA